TRQVAQAYLKFLYSPQAQEIEARNFYRPRSPTVAARYAAQFPKVNTFTLADVFGTWRQVQAKFFADGGVFDQIGPGNSACAVGCFRASASAWGTRLRIW